MTTTHRVLIVLRAVMRRWHTLKELAALVNRSTKTILRDLDAIATAGFKLRWKEGRRGLRHWKVD